MPGGPGSGGMIAAAAAIAMTTQIAPAMYLTAIAGQHVRSSSDENREAGASIETEAWGSVPADASEACAVADTLAWFGFSPKNRIDMPRFDREATTGLRRLMTASTDEAIGRFSARLLKTGDWSRGVVAARVTLGLGFEQLDGASRLEVTAIAAAETGAAAKPLRFSGLADEPIPIAYLRVRSLERTDLDSDPESDPSQNLLIVNPVTVPVPAPVALGAMGLIAAVAVRRRAVASRSRRSLRNTACLSMPTSVRHCGSTIVADRTTEGRDR